jgi:predicted dehydrogenase
VVEPVRIGVIGCGSVATGAYLPQLQRLNLRGVRSEVVAACDVDPARLDTVRDRFGVARLTTDFRELVAAPEVELVLVLTSMPAHGAIARASLEAGKHVLVEKPMATTLAEASELLAVAARSQGYLVCAPHVTLSPTYQAIWRRVAGGDVGRVLSARGFYGWSGPDWGPWFYRTGGGALFDLGVYNVTTLTGLLGPAKRVLALCGTAIPERVVGGAPVRVEADDNAQVLLDFGEAVYAVVTTGFTIQRYRCAGIELYGSEGTIQMIGEDWAPAGYELWQNRAGCWQIYEDGSRWHWTDGVRDLIEAIRRGTPPTNRPEHAFHVLEIMLKAMESGRTGQALPVESTFEPPRFDAAGAGEATHRVHDPSRDG